jgi:hypothetical protein
VDDGSSVEREARFGLSGVVADPQDGSHAGKNVDFIQFKVSK